MLHLQETCGEDLPDYPEDVPVLDTTFYMHPSGMVGNHNFPCPVCQENHAVYDMGEGIMKPCRKCEKKYALVRKPELKPRPIETQVIINVAVIVGSLTLSTAYLPIEELGVVLFTIVHSAVGCAAGALALKLNRIPFKDIFS